MKLRWGVIGCADFAARRSIPAMRAASLVDLVAVASRSSEKAQQFATAFGVERAYGSYQELLDDPDIDVVYIVLPNSLHAEWTIKSLQRGKHVLCEKPFAIEPGEVIQVKVILGSPGAVPDLKVSEAFMWRYHPQHQLALQAISDGSIGEVRLVRAAFTFTANSGDGDIRFNFSLGGGSLLDVGCYPISASRLYFGGEPKKVTAVARHSGEHGVDTTVSAMMTFPNGTALIDCGFEAPYRGDLEIVGTRGRIYIPKAWQPDEQATVRQRAGTRSFPVNQYVVMFDLFSKAVLKHASLPFDIDDAEKQTKALHAVRSSFETLSEVRI